MKRCRSPRRIIDGNVILLLEDEAFGADVDGFRCRIELEEGHAPALVNSKHWGEESQ